MIDWVGRLRKRSLTPVSCNSNIERRMNRPKSAVRVIGFWFLVCYAATQLATQLQQKCIQVVCSNEEARKRLTESNGTPAMDLGHMNVVLK